jgi:hypothetical protein
VSDSQRPTDPAPPSFASAYGGDPTLYLIDRVAALSDAVCSPEGIVAMIRQEGAQHHEQCMSTLRTLTDAVLRIEARVNELADEQDHHAARIKLVERQSGNGASK